MNRTQAESNGAGRHRRITGRLPGRRGLVVAGVSLVAALAAARYPQWSWAAGGFAAAIVLLGTPAARVQGGAGRAVDSITLERERPLVHQVMPVWSRQIESARELADETTSNMLLTFAGISDGLESALNAAEAAAAGLGASAADEFVSALEEALERLLGPLRTSTEARKAMLTVLGKTLAGVGALHVQADEIKGLARRTNMIAFNASVEATQSSGGDTEEVSARGGFSVVAQEVRLLAQQSSEAGNRIIEIISGLESELRALHAREAAQDTSDEELRAQSQACARDTISALLAKLREVGKSGRGMREASGKVRDEVEAAMVGFQANDRFSQMLGSIIEDIERMTEWLNEGQDQSGAQAAAWLQRLEGSYTMEEQRSQHHGHGTIERSAGVEFF